MRIRPANKNDADGISRLNGDVQKLHADALPRLFKPPSPEVFPPSVIQEWLDDPNTYVFIAELDNQPVGYIYAEIWDQPENSWRYARRTVYIHHITVMPEYQTKGYGAQLMGAVKDLAREKSIPTIALDVWSFNKKARTFFTNQGFTNYNERMWLELD
jgi:GNAT superfamily N-acetyltransferase